MAVDVVVVVVEGVGVVVERRCSVGGGSGGVVVWCGVGRRGKDGGRHPDKPTSVLGRFGRQVQVLTLHDSNASCQIGTHTTHTHSFTMQGR